MKCTQAEQSILLAQSGELSWFGRRRLNGHIASCAACRAYRDELEQLTTLTRRAGADLATPDVPVTRLANRGRNYAVRFLPTREPWSVTFRPAFVYASISLMVVLALFLITRPYFRPVQVAVQQAQPVEEFDSAWTNGFDNQLTELDSSLALASWDSTVTEATESDDLNSVAGELLELEEQKI